LRNIAGLRRGAVSITPASRGYSTSGEVPEGMEKPAAPGLDHGLGSGGEAGENDLEAASLRQVLGRHPARVRQDDSLDDR
jgi:hypothetical protein